ncbi:MAG: VanZ family protein [Lachnospiraceae bacterium]|nr:VanZ family protein [Lachnospiraceae bacterium]
MKNRRILILFSWVLYIIYISGLIYFLFFSERFGRHSLNEYHYNLEPFSEIKRYIHYCDIIGFKWVFINLVGNVVAFIPFGMAAPLYGIRKMGFVFIFIYGLLFTFLIEIIQLVNKIGSFDIDDIILNTSGVIIGYCIYKLVKVCRKDNIRNK